MANKCFKCGKDITAVKDFGGHVLGEGKDLCSECWHKWITMRNEHRQQEETFLNDHSGKA